jgi:hypothetical protein
MLLPDRECFASECDDHSFKALYDSGQLFELREAVKKAELRFSIRVFSLVRLTTYAKVRRNFRALLSPRRSRKTLARLAPHWPLSTSEMDAFEKLLGKKDSKKVATMGSSKQVDSIALPKLELRIGGFPTALRPAHILYDGSAGGCHYGTLRMDLMKQSQRSTIDFESMTLTMC